MKVVIANSIGVDKNNNFIIHSPSRWSEGVKSKSHWFAYYPWELSYLSSLLKKETDFNIKFLDGCLMQWDSETYFSKITTINPDVLIMESATRMIDENVNLARRIKQKCQATIIFVGQHASAFPQELLTQGIDYVCIGEYEYTVLELLQNKDKRQILGLYPNPRRDLLDINSLPWPEDSDVKRIDYASPGEPSSEYREIQMYASRGCPGSCSFCVARHVYYNQPNWRPRKIENIISEIIYLKNKYPKMEGVFFDEEVHNGRKDFILDLTQAIIDAKLNNLKYEAMCDVRFLDEQILGAMKRAGYYKIRIGIETASRKIMQQINKKIDLKQVFNLLKLAQKIGIKTYGTFTFGAPGSNETEDKKTILLIQDLINNDYLDNLQLSICTPQPGTPFYEKVKENHMLRNDLTFNIFDGGNHCIINYPDYHYKIIEKTKQNALLMRDHFFLKNKIQNKTFFQWIGNVYKKHGVFRSAAKAFFRILTEIKFYFVK
ncbi:MAG: radical SAM protein [Candidatus Omnitrophota bacterium]